MKRIVSWILYLLLTSCDSYHIKLKGTEYSVGWINMPELATISYNETDGFSIGVGIENRVTDVYWNKDYIIAKRCKQSSDTLIGYYILELLPKEAKKGIPCNIHGPMSETELLTKERELKLDRKKMRHINIFD